MPRGSDKRPSLPERAEFDDETLGEGLMCPVRSILTVVKSAGDSVAQPCVVGYLFVRCG